MSGVLRALVSVRVRALMSLGMVLGLGAVGTSAAWSTSTTTTSGVFSTGTVDIALSGNQGNPTPFQVVFASPVALLPGQSVAATLPVQNLGGLPFTYTISAVGTDTLGAALTLTGSAGAVSATNNTCTGGTPLAPAPGSLATAQSFGGTRGPLAATAGVETLCLQFQLPVTAPNTLQGASGTVLLTFTATSV